MEYPCGRHDFLKDLVVSKKDMQRTAPGDCQRTIHEELKEGVGGAEGKRIFVTRAKEAQVDKVGRRKEKGKDYAKIGGDKNNESMVRPCPLLFLASGSQHR